MKLNSINDCEVYDLFRKYFLSYSVICQVLVEKLGLK